MSSRHSGAEMQTVGRVEWRLDRQAAAWGCCTLQAAAPLLSLLELKWAGQTEPTVYICAWCCVGRETAGSLQAGNEMSSQSDRPVMVYVACLDRPCCGVCQRVCQSRAWRVASMLMGAEESHTQYTGLGRSRARTATRYQTALCTSCRLNPSSHQPSVIHAASCRGNANL